MKITDSIHALKIPFEIPGAGFWREVYVYIIVQDKITIIDSGVSGSESLIFEYLQDISRKPEEISTLLITYAHPDHIGSAKAIQDQTGCKIGAHKSVVRWIENIEFEGLKIKKKLQRIQRIINSWIKICTTRMFGNLVIDSDLKPEKGKDIPPQRDSLDYLMVISHSINRNTFTKKLASEFTPQLDKLLRKGVSNDAP